MDNSVISLPEDSTPQLLPDQQRFEDVFGQFLTITAVPTDIPKNAKDQIRIYKSGSSYRLYIYDKTNNAWVAFGIVPVVSSLQYYSQEYSNGTVSGTYNIDWNNGNSQYVTLIGDTTLTFTNAGQGSLLSLTVAYSGVYALTLPGTVRFPSNVSAIPTSISGRADEYRFKYSGIEGLYHVIQSANFQTT